MSNRLKPKWEDHYRLFCSEITCLILEADRSRQFGFETSPGIFKLLWLNDHDQKPGFFGAMRVLYSRFMRKPFRQVEHSEISATIREFLISLDPHQVLSFLKYGAVEGKDLCHLEERLEQQGLLKLESDELLSAYSRCKDLEGVKIVSQDFELEPIHQGLAPTLKVEHEDPPPSQDEFKPPEPLTLDHPQVIEELHKIKTKRDEVEAVKSASYVIFHPDKIAVQNLVKSGSIVVPDTWAVHKSIYPVREVLVSSNFSRLLHAKRAIIILPDRATFVKRCSSQYPQHDQVFSTWYDDVLKHIYSCPSTIWAIELSNRNLHSSTLVSRIRCCRLTRPLAPDGPSPSGFPDVMDLG